MFGGAVQHREMWSRGFLGRPRISHDSFICCWCGAKAVVASTSCWRQTVQRDNSESFMHSSGSTKGKSWHSCYLVVYYYTSHKILDVSLIITCAKHCNYAYSLVADWKMKCYWTIIDWLLCSVCILLLIKDVNGWGHHKLFSLPIFVLAKVP